MPVNADIGTIDIVSIGRGDPYIPIRSGRAASARRSGSTGVAGAIANAVSSRQGHAGACACATCR